ncbi:D-alanyl-D-alanine carboxypeptidase/D-alanyl-D-alanine endopeptidase [Sphingomonas sp. Y38-1Y]|uniref:D-alanyl-D-alanine carboxypeptidase/D-alanyl-D-alanine endopeptidase n=1 Tax=Sphingomonas sp. Y38-1Y TaxID=3078265 RepID=UPI0028EBCBA7|nr:D-alanyl-D-alanine carboxypeptidase/D-alanyl-D-alanine-endopeptidase [Sphingomonas sp. Y38-1Y]
MRVLTLLLALAACAPVARPGPAPPPLADRVRTILTQPGTRWGLLVVDEGGREIVAIDPDARFVPASNSKLPAVLSAMTSGEPAQGTAVAIEGEDVVLIGAGDPWLSSADDCARDCLATLADAVAARTKRVRDVIGDDRRWPDERWGQGWSWNNLATRSGTAISALSLDENVTTLTVRPGAEPSVEASGGWYTVEARVTTGTTTALSVDRLPGERRLVVRGTIAGTAAVTLVQSIDDPALYAAHRLAGMLRARGVVVGGTRVRHRVAAEPVAVEAPVLARLTPPGDDESYARTLKASQNLFAELLLRRAGDGSGAGGLARYEGLFGAAGAARTGWDFADGSGMSNYNRLSPRASVALLRWAAGQPFAARFRSALAVGGVDGTLAQRFRGTPLEGRLWAKTGSLSGASALSGYLTAASGRTLTFAVFANDMPSGAGSPTAAMDAALLAIAAAN